MERKPNRGDIVLFDPEPTRGTELQKVRPALVISNNAINTYTQQAVVIPFTKQSKRVDLPDTIPIKKSKSNGLSDDSILYGIHIKSVSQLRLIEKIGSIEEKYWSDIEPLCNNILGFTS